MKTNGQLIFLGTGGSMGVPVIGCHCEVCRSESSNNKRLRPSALLHMNQKNIVIDAGPDYRLQALKYNINHLDGVIFTHAHHDHTAGIDDLRAYYMHTGQVISCLLSNETVDDLRSRYHYIFANNKSKHQLTTSITLQVLERGRGEVSFLGLQVGYFTFEQAGMTVNGFRFGNLGFVSDISRYPESIFEDLEGIDILVLSALRFEPSPLHFNIDEAVDFSQRLGVKETWLTHIAHEVDHEKTNAYLPSNIQLAYDGLSLDFLAEVAK
ncbi:MAG: MBL fold metallo-hydrolase [Waddliaceae bacterium]